MRTKGEIIIEINIDNEKRMVKIWLSHNEHTDIEVSEVVDEICRNNLHSGYRTVVFVSGTHSLVDSTEGLLCQNLGL